jgi:sulfite reductase alpha subunit-like flavoprotein
LCGEGSKKDTRHFEFDLKDWGLNYEVGDSMTAWPTNDPALVDEIIAKIGAKGDESVKGPNGQRPCAKRCFAIAALPKQHPNS